MGFQMRTTTISPALMERAEALIQEILQANQARGLEDGLPEGAFMAHRPNTLSESYQHGLAVAQILGSWQVEPALQLAGLLHSFVCKGVLSAERIASTCDARSAFLCQKYWEILQQQPQSRHRKKSPALRRVKLYIAAYCDPALAFLGLASLWDHFILARQSEPGLQRLFAEEAQEVMIPLLDLLGISALKTEVEEWLMQRVKNQPDYEYLLKRLTQTEEMRTYAFSLVEEKLQPVLPDAQISCKPQTPAQIYNPRLPEKAHPEALQKLSVDLLVDTEEACYMALRWIHRFWQPVEYSLVDHIGVSEVNGDRYLLTTVILPLGNNHIKAHFNIRTREMEQINLWGLIALQTGAQEQVELPRTWWRSREADYQKIDSAPLGALPETLYVFSPRGEIFRFFRGCTVVDYAYQVHSEVAHQCKRFKINGEAVGPATPLHHLDLVELEQDPQFPGPNRAWLQAARTYRARSHIERFLKRQIQDHSRGRVLVEHRLQQLVAHYRIDIPQHRLEQALDQAMQRLNFERRETLLAEIAAGRVSTDPILHPLFSAEIARQIENPEGARLLPHQLNLAQCCKPRPGDDIVGRARYRKDTIINLKVHRADCQHLINLPGIIHLQWRLQPKLNALARLEVAALARPNLLYDALNVFQADLSQITLHKVDAVARQGTAHINFTVEAQDRRVIEKLARALETLPGHDITEVRQMQLLFSEREELAKPLTPAGYNPYRRQPVQNREMFFGRAEELARIYEMLQTGVGVIFVQGQKRVGKTSLLLHLKKYYLNRRLNIPVFIDFQMLGQLSSPAIHYEIARAIYHDLQAENRVTDLEPPLQELFEADPPTQLADYLRAIQGYFGGCKLVLLIDEFSRTLDAYQQNRLDDMLFLQWRGIIQATVPEISYVMVVQQQTYDDLCQQPEQARLAPIWHLLELGETRILKPLSEAVAQQLIERPTYNHLEYTPEALQYVWRLTGGSPFLIQAFCYNLVRHMAHANRRRVEWIDVDAVQAEFMQPHESLFAHLVDVVQSIPQAIPICKQLAKSLNKSQPAISFVELTASLPHLPVDQLRSTLRKLINQYILVESDTDKWQFASLLFGRWLAINIA
jgi:GTP pyrophosphokinase